MINKTKTISCSAIAAVGVLTALDGTVEAQTATAPVVGVKEQVLQNGQFNLVGLNLHNRVVVSGTIDAVASNNNGTPELDDDFSVLTENDVTLTTALGASGSATYILEITSGSLAGTIQEVTSWTANTFNTPDDVVTEGLVTGTTYVIRKAATLQEVLGDPAIIGQGGSAAVADVVWIPDGSGDYTRYFYQTGLFGSGWFNDTASTAVSGDIPIVFSDGFFVQVKNGNVTLPVSGAVKTGNLSLAVMTGFNLVGNIYPEGATLQNSGLENSLQQSGSAANADVLWIPDGSGDYTRYFFQTGLFGSGWFNDTAGASVVADVPLPPAFFIQRKGAATNATASQPPAFTNLP